MCASKLIKSRHAPQKFLHPLRISRVDNLGLIDTYAAVMLSKVVRWTLHLANSLDSWHSSVRTS